MLCSTYAYKNDINLKVVTIRILAFLGGCILALLKAACSLPKKELDVNKKNLLVGTKLRWTWSNQKASLQCSLPPVQESVPGMPA